ncbi:hypothetical protein AALB19_18030, partial [Oscillospiraceae bacterium 50-58]
CLYCWLILFCQSLQTFLRIILDTTERGGEYFAAIVWNKKFLGTFRFQGTFSVSRQKWWR